MNRLFAAFLSLVIAGCAATQQMIAESRSTDSRGCLEERTKH